MGFTSCSMASAMSRSGSSPHMWGLPFKHRRAGHNARFIPTHVGFTSSLSAMETGKRGSSPRMWGLRLNQIGVTLDLRFTPTQVGFTQSCVATFFRSVRFIPTHVGFTFRPVRRSILTTVHPHTCGVYEIAAIEQDDPNRFIPTHVGFTVSTP